MAESFIFYSAFILFILLYWLDLSHSDILQFAAAEPWVFGQTTRGHFYNKILSL